MGFCKSQQSSPPEAEPKSRWRLIDVTSGPVGHGHTMTVSLPCHLAVSHSPILVSIHIPIPPMAIPSYIAVPPSASLIGSPNVQHASDPARRSTPASGGLKRTGSMSSQTPSVASATLNNSNTNYISTNLNSGVFPPAAAPITSPQRRFTVPTTSSISSNVSDLVLSSLLPPNIPKVAATHTPGRVRELTSQKESLGLNVMSGNFTRFIIKVSAN